MLHILQTKKQTTHGLKKLMVGPSSKKMVKREPYNVARAPLKSVVLKIHANNQTKGSFSHGHKANVVARLMNFFKHSVIFKSALPLEHIALAISSLGVVFFVYRFKTYKTDSKAQANEKEESFAYSPMEAALTWAFGFFGNRAATSNGLNLLNFLSSKEGLSQVVKLLALGLGAIKLYDQIYAKIESFSKTNPWTRALLIWMKWIDAGEGKANMINSECNLAYKPIADGANNVLNGASIKSLVLKDFLFLTHLCERLKRKKLNDDARTKILQKATDSVLGELSNTVLNVCKFESDSLRPGGSRFEGYIKEFLELRHAIVSKLAKALQCSEHSLQVVGSPSDLDTPYEQIFGALERTLDVLERAQFKTDVAQTLAMLNLPNGFKDLFEALAKELELEAANVKSPNTSPSTSPVESSTGEARGYITNHIHSGEAGASTSKAVEVGASTSKAVEVGASTTVLPYKEDSLAKKESSVKPSATNVDQTMVLKRAQQRFNFGTGEMLFNKHLATVPRSSKESLRFRDASDLTCKNRLALAYASKQQNQQQCDETKTHVREVLNLTLQKNLLNNAFFLSLVKGPSSSSGLDNSVSRLIMLSSVLDERPLYAVERPLWAMVPRENEPWVSKFQASDLKKTLLKPSNEFALVTGDKKASLALVKLHSSQPERYRHVHPLQPLANVITRKSVIGVLKVANLLSFSNTIPNSGFNRQMPYKHQQRTKDEQRGHSVATESLVQMQSLPRTRPTFKPDEVSFNMAHAKACGLDLFVTGSNSMSTYVQRRNKQDEESLVANVGSLACPESLLWNMPHAVPLKQCFIFDLWASEIGRRLQTFADETNNITLNAFEKQTEVQMKKAMTCLENMAMNRLICFHLDWLHYDELPGHHFGADEVYRTLFELYKAPVQKALDDVCSERELCKQASEIKQTFLTALTSVANDFIRSAGGNRDSIINQNTGINERLAQNQTKAMVAGLRLKMATDVHANLLKRQSLFANLKALPNDIPLILRSNIEQLSGAKFDASNANTKASCANLSNSLDLGYSQLVTEFKKATLPQQCDHHVKAFYEEQVLDLVVSISKPPLMGHENRPLLESGVSMGSENQNPLDKPRYKCGIRAKSVPGLTNIDWFFYQATTLSQNPVITEIDDDVSFD